MHRAASYGRVRHGSSTRRLAAAGACHSVGGRLLRLRERLRVRDNFNFLRLDKPLPHSPARKTRS